MTPSLRRRRREVSPSSTDDNASEVDETSAQSYPVGAQNSRGSSRFSTQKRKRQQGTSFTTSFFEWFRAYVSAVLVWFLAIAVNMLIVLMTLLAGVFAMYVVYEYALEALAPAMKSLCAVPGISILGLTICSPPPPPPEPPQFLREGLDYGAKLSEMQKIGANSIELPYLLQISEGSVRSMIVQLSAVDLPSKYEPPFITYFMTRAAINLSDAELLTRIRDKLLPLLKEYRELADGAIDGLQDTLARIDQGVDMTININSWASYELALIEERRSSMLAPLRDYVAAKFNFPANSLSTETEVRQALIGLTDGVQNKMSQVLVNMRRDSDTLRQLQDVLDNIAITVLGDKTKLQREKLKHKSYWKWLLRSYRDQMSDFDTKMEICAAFYAHVEQAFQVVSTTKFKMQQIRSELILFRDRLQEAPLHLQHNRKGSLQMYIKTLNTGVEALEASKKSTKLLKAERIRKLEAKLLSEGANM
jgi:hypothetical protein